jgi:hypothetical protein
VACVRAALRRAAPGLSDGALIGFTAVAFGLAHLYQGWPGMTLTGLLDLRILALPLDAVPLPAPKNEPDRPVA